MPREILPAKNVRRAIPRNCTTCRFLKFGDGWADCTRPNGPSFDTGDRQFDLTVCDRWTVLPDLVAGRSRDETPELED